MKHRVSSAELPIVKILHNEYAAFRPEVISWALENALRDAHSILDPFAGTARLLPYVATAKIRGHFNDVLPHHKFINEAKLPEVYAALRSMGVDCWSSVRSDLSKCLSPLKRSNLKVTPHWMRSDIVERFRRSWEIIDSRPATIRPLFRAVLVLCVRPLSGVTPSAKNRTWLRPGGMTTEKPLHDLVDSYLIRYKKYYETYYRSFDFKTSSNCTFTYMETSKISKKQKYDVIFTSPPFPNRFDYAVTYAPELYMLSQLLSDFDYNSLSALMIGTNKVSDYQNPDSDLQWLHEIAPTTFRFLRNVHKLAPPSEGTYYLRYFTRYYRDLYRFILSAVGSLKPDGSLYLTVQNNIHRGELNNIAAFLVDFANHNDLRAQKCRSWMRRHQGRRNISADHPLVLKKHEESIVRILRT